MSEQKTTNDPNEENTVEGAASASSIEFAEKEETHSEVVELSWEEVEQTLQLRQLYSENEQAFARFLVDAERRKQAMSARLTQVEEAIYQNASTLRNSKDLNPDWTYEMKLPEKAGEKGYFVRKEE